MNKMIKTIVFLLLMTAFIWVACTKEETPQANYPNLEKGLKTINQVYVITGMDSIFFCVPSYIENGSISVKVGDAQFEGIGIVAYYNETSPKVIKVAPEWKYVKFSSTAYTTVQISNITYH